MIGIRSFEGKYGKLLDDLNELERARRLLKKLKDAETEEEG